MIQNDTELQGTQERIAYFCSIVANLRKTETPQNFPFMASGYLAEIDRMNAEMLEYLSRHASTPIQAEAA